MAETISSEDPGNGASYTPGHSEPQMRSGARATALTTAVSLVLAGGVVTAAVRNAGHSASAESLAPASSFGFAQVDLSLADGQSSALSSFLGHFPDSPTKKGSGSLRDRVLAAMFRDSTHPHVDYAKDVKPWLGDHVAVAGWLDGNGKPQVEFLLRSTDDAKARASLHKLGPSLGVVFSKGYAVVGRTQALAQSALTAARKSSLADDAQMQSDLGKLSGPQVISGWLDAARIGKALQSLGHGMTPFAMPGGAMPGFGVMPGFGSIAGLGSSAFKGRAVIGVHATKTYAELVMQTIDAGTNTSSLAPASMLSKLPNSTIGAAEIAAPGKIVAAAWTFLGAILGARASFSSSASGSIALGSGGAYSSTVKVCPNVASCTVTGGNSMPAITRPQPVNRPSPTQQIEQATGLKLPGDAVTLLGSAAVVAYGGLHGRGLPNIALVTQPADVATARALAEHSRDVIAQHTGVTPAVGTSGSDLVVASNPDYESTVEVGGQLGSQPRFVAAMGALPDQVGFAAYVDLADVLPLLSHSNNKDVDHLDAFGLWVGRVGNDERFQARLVVR